MMGFVVGTIAGMERVPLSAPMKGESMPLSNHERRELEEIERSLYAEDPNLDATVKSSDIGFLAVKRLRLGIAIALLGLVVLVTGVALPNVPVGAVGFLGMFAGGALTVPSLTTLAALKKTPPNE